MPEFEVVYRDGTFTEGPVWDGSRVIFTDIPTSRILAYDPASDTTTTLFEDTEKAVGLAMDPEGRIYGCLDGGRAVVRFEEDGSRTVVADRFEGWQLNSPNDLAIDADGRVWFSDPRYGPERSDLELDHESVLLARPDGDEWLVERATFDTTRPNGVLLDSARRILYVAQTHMPPPDSCRELRAYPILDDHTLGPAEVVFDFGVHRGVDGMTLAPDGSVVAACGWTKSGPGPRIAVFGPDHRLKAEFPTADNPSNCCFGGPDGRDLYVTGRDGALNRMTGLLEADGSSPW